jgi:hypothetical protein
LAPGGGPVPEPEDMVKEAQVVIDVMGFLTLRLYKQRDWRGVKFS